MIGFGCRELILCLSLFHRSRKPIIMGFSISASRETQARAKECVDGVEAEK
jgi:hypothetical protein